MASTGNARKTKKAAAITLTPLLYYPLDGNINNYQSGSAVADATIIGTGAAISTTVSATGMASLYNTTNTTSYLKLPTIPANTGGYSFSFWFNFAATTTGMVFTFVNTATGTSRIFLYWENSALVFGTNAYTTGKGTFVNAVGASSSFTTNTWYHLVWTLSTGGTNIWYLNGVAQPSFTTFAYISTIFQEARILGDVYNGTAGPGANAYVNDFRYYNAILTSAQVTTIYNDSKTKSVRSIPGCILWLDAKDPSNTGAQPANNALITTWYDKSGIGNNAVANSGITYNTTGLNGYPTLNFPGTKWLTGPVVNTGSTMSIFMVYVLNGTTVQNQQRMLSLGKLTVGDWTSTSYTYIQRWGTNDLVPYRSGTYGQYIPIVNSGPFLIEYWFDGSLWNVIHHNGTATQQKTMSSTGNFNIENFVIANNTVYEGGAVGFISEIVVYNTALTTTQRQFIEGYLSWKWGLQDKLSPLHPNNSIYDFAFKIKAGNTTVPLKTTAGYNYPTTYDITNTSAVNVSVASSIVSRSNVLNFSGSNFISLPYNLPVTYTLSFWLSSSTVTAGEGTIFKSARMLSRFFGTNTLRYVILYQITGQWASCISTVAQNTTWNLYTMVQTATNVKMYVNRNLTTTTTGATSWTGDTGTIYFGNGTNIGYSGYCDDMRIYPRALSVTEITNLYNEYVPIDFVFQIKGTASVPTTTTAGYGYVTTYAITNTGGVVTTSTVGTRTNVFYLSGTNILSLPYRLPITITRTFWCSSTTSQLGYSNVFSSKKNPIWFLNSKFLRSSVNFGASPVWADCFSTTTQTDAWLFYAIAQTATTVSLYVNGILAQTITNTGWFGETDEIIWIGGYGGNSGNFTGYVDDMRVYARALSAAEILTLYTAG